MYVCMYVCMYIESKQFQVKYGTLTLIYNTGWKIIETYLSKNTP